MQQSIKTSVALCTYNGISFLEDQLHSIFNQSSPVDEMIICDDGSTDGTIELIQKFIRGHNFNIRLFINDVNLRVLKNFEKALSLCTGDIIFLSDQDDIWEVDKVKKIREYFGTYPEKTIVFTNASLLENDRKLTDTAWDRRDFNGLLKEDLKDPLKMLKHLLLHWNIATGATMALRRESLAHYLPFGSFENHLHDHLLVLMAAAGNKLGFIDECLTTYRLHPDQQIGFRKRKVPFYIWPAYRLAQIIKKAVLKNKRLKQKKVIGKYLEKYAADYPPARGFLESLSL